MDHTAGGGNRCARADGASCFIFTDLPSYCV